MGSVGCAVSCAVSCDAVMGSGRLGWMSEGFGVSAWGTTRTGI